MAEQPKPQGSSGSGTALTPKPLGEIPRGYAAERAPTEQELGAALSRGIFGVQNAPGTRILPSGSQFGATGQVETPARYTQGMEYFPGMAGNVDDIIDLQNGLIAAGLLDPKQVDYGIWDETSVTAYRKLLTEANASGRTQVEQLNYRLTAAQEGRLSAQNAAQKALRAEQPPLTITLDNPEDIKALLKDTTMKLYSGSLTPEQEDLFTMLVQNAQADFQRAQYAQQYNPGYSREPGSETNYYGPGGTLTAPPSGAGLAKQAEEFVKNANPEQVFTSLVGQQLAGIIPSLGLPAGGLAR